MDSPTPVGAIANGLKNPVRANRKGRGGIVRNCVFRNQVEIPLKWIVEFWGRRDAPLFRDVGLPMPLALLEIVFDASPWGLGAYLQVAATAHILEYFSDKIHDEDADRFGAAVGDPAGQQLWESLSMLVGLPLWSRKLASQATVLRVRGDSVVAVKLASSSALSNAIGAELALELEVAGIMETVTSHTPGVLNSTADWLSRRFAPGSTSTMPRALSEAKERIAPRRDDTFYRVWRITA